MANHFLTYTFSPLPIYKHESLIELTCLIKANNDILWSHHSWHVNPVDFKEASKILNRQNKIYSPLILRKPFRYPFLGGVHIENLENFSVTLSKISSLPQTSELLLTPKYVRTNFILIPSNNNLLSRVRTRN